MLSPKFKIYSSSAGSGKTYTLAKEYIKLALKTTSPWYFNHILAVTFTKKASQEMKERILKYLKQFASTDPQEIEESEGIFQQILAELKEEGINIDEWTLRDRANKTFKHIIHEYANFSVSTIDSFVQRIVAAFTEELGFPFNFEVNLDSDVLLEGAVEQLFQKVNTENFEQITEAIQSFAMEKANDGKSWNGLPSELASFGRSLLSDQFQASVESIAELQPADFLLVEKNLKEYSEYIETKIKTIANIASNTIYEANLDIEDFSQKKNGVGAYFQRLEFQDVFYKANSYVEKALSENLWYSKTQKKDIAARIDGISDELRLYLEEIAKIHENEKPKYVLFQEVTKQLKKLALLSQLKREIAEIQNDTGQIHISEFNRKILEIVMTEPIPFVYERLGEKYNHILIDEFQDTSTLQWHNFLPLVENSLANGHFNLAVGDAKQSIYRFRGGEMELIVHLHKEDLEKLVEGNEDNDFLTERYASIRPYLKPENLTTNYRSSKEIIKFNNDIFQFIKESPDNEAIAPILPKVYDEHFAQKIPNNPKSGGHVEIDFLTGDGEDELMFDRILELIDESLAAGYAYEDIAVLCRKNQHARIVANSLKDANIQVISSDSLNLNFSEAVNLTMALMKVIQNPENTLAKYEAIYLFYRVVLQKIPNTDDNQIIKQSIENKDVNQFYALIEKQGYLLSSFRLQQMALYEVAEKIINTFHLFEHHKELDFLFRFLDVVLDFQTKKSTHLTDFLQFWEQKKNVLSISTPDGQNAVTVTSIHKSKGLEYPVVIIPYCHWTMDTGLFSEIWANLPNELELKPNQDSILKTAPLRVSNKLAETVIAPQFHAEKEKTFLESLNMLYVALTRPTDRLYLIIKQDTFKFDKTVGNQLYRFVGCPPIEKGERHIEIISQGENKRISNKPKKVEQVIEIDAVMSSERSNTIKLRHSAERLFDIETFEKSRDYGNKIHNTFAKIRTLTDIDFALQESLREGLIVDTELEEIKASILKIINLEKIKPLFEVHEDLVKNEREILMPKGNPLRPDRVVRLKDRIVILDYKTGSKSESHKTQVRQYMNIYRDMGHKNVEGILVYLEGDDIVAVV
ncbi:UvrD-helicase domain-containing protein [Arcicella sp. LKC2W]|uniref:UvrD-helicase domain-containing protein n=1 Tax=Arcicella sp. LKC2W TaxID=2984198 RepID=UPI002B1F779D|nr:UvrD-helicase domain-containing protein [Arcicella sp. LKC2W]MEA5457694.1 UvrD-helicase domain-containing protein [Arcicella sp. LKC2W]